MSNSAAHGTVSHDEVHIVIRDQDVHFGRAPGNDIRIGHAPILDEIVPRSTGFITVHRGRLVVANTDDRLAFDIVLEGAAPIAVRPGMMVSPAEAEFDIAVVGTFPYTIAVAQNVAGSRVRVLPTDAVPDDGLPTGARLDLNARQRQVLDTYVAPVLTGASPASHQQVADALGISRSLVRLECNRIWSKMLLAGIPMRELTDTRDQIVDAWTRHRL
jgi:hypothetical protein